MTISEKLIEKYGDPTKDLKVFEARNMVLWDIPSYINAAIPALPNRLYCNKDLIHPLSQSFENLKETGYDKELKTWDGCFNIRKKRGSKSTSLHSWGIAIDLNSAWNGFGKTPTLSPEFVKCFTDAGFDWGGNFGRLDGMHFQLAKI